MNELTKRLRLQADENACDGYPEWAATMRAAAVEVEALREALAQISLTERDVTSPAHLKVRDMARTAREALDPHA